MTNNKEPLHRYISTDSGNYIEFIKGNYNDNRQCNNYYTSQTKNHKPFQAPPLPAHFVDRPEYSSDLKNRLLTESADVSTLVITAIHGLGSVGKSTLAAALAHDVNVQAHFCDGILWATLGQQPDVLSLLSGWIQALGDYNFKPTSVDAATIQLRTLLYDKAVLLVVDDVWNTEDAQAFNVAGARCQVLVTTREAVIAKVLGASTYPLDVMKPSQAMELLTKKLERKVTDTETQEAEALAASVGYLPLALELAAAQVTGGTSWTVLLQDMQQEVARLKTLDDKSARDANDEVSLKRLSLTASLNLSIQRLPEVTRENFIWLGILPEDVNITQAMTATLWDMDSKRDVADELSYLHSKALLLSGVPLASGTPTYRLHDLFHDLARNLLTAPPKPKRTGNLPGLGITLPVAHATFLEKYRNLTDKNLWHTLPYDGYIHQHLVWHLEKAEQVEEIHSLLREESETGGNGWYEACDQLGQTANFVTDVARAWQLAEDDKQVEVNLPHLVGLQCRYALMISSLNSLAANLPIELLFELVRKNVWTPEQGLAYALQNPNPDRKTRSLAKLADHLPPNLKELALSKALVAAREIEDEYYRVEALSTFVDKLPELLPEALAAAREIWDDEQCAYALSSLFDKQLPLEFLPEVLAVAREECSDSNHAYVLNSLVDKLPLELLPEVLAAAREIQDEEQRADILSRLADKLPELLPEALAATREIQNDYNRAYALNSLVDKLPELLPEALAWAREIKSVGDRVNALIRLADELPELLLEALAAAREIEDKRHRANALNSLADKLPELLPEALAAAMELWDEDEDAVIRSGLKPPPGSLLEAQTATEIWDNRHRAYALNSLADKLPPELLLEALATTRKIHDEYYRADVLNSLADKLPELLPEALTAAMEIESKYNRANILSSLADKLPELLPEALAAMENLHYNSRRSDDYSADILNSFVDKLPLELLPEALAAAREIQRYGNIYFYRDNPLSSLIDKLPPELLLEALIAVEEIWDKRYPYCADSLSGYRADILSHLPEKLPELLPEALAAVREIESEDHRANALIRLADKLPELLPEALGAARGIQDERHRANALIRLAEKLPELLPEALGAARGIQDEYYRVDALIRLTEKLPELLLEALGAAREIQSERHRADALSSLVDKLPELLPQALATAREIQSERHRAYALSSLVDKLPELLPEALAAVREIQDERHRADALSSLAEKLPQLLPAVAAVREIQDEDHRADALIRLADKLLELLPEALAAAMEIRDEDHRANTLSSLIDKVLQVQKTQLFSVWQDILHVLSLRTRANLLTQIKALTPVIFTLGGEKSVKDIASSIQDVSRWWC